MFVVVDDFDPFFETFPLSEQNEEIILTNFVEGLHFFKPLFDGNKLSWFAIHKFADALAAEGIVVVDFFRNYFRVGHHLHIVVVVLVYLNHVDKLICCQFLLTHHLKKCLHLFVSHFFLMRGRRA